MKPKLMVTDGDKLEERTMFFYPSDDYTRPMVGCLTRNTMVLYNANKFISIDVVKEKNRYMYQLLNKKGQIVYHEYSKRSPEERITNLPVAEYLIKEINSC